MKITIIVWARYHRRSELLAQHLGATIHYICHGRMGQLSQAPVRYLVQAWQTWRILCQDRPDIIFVQNPPIFAVLLTAIYARFYNARYVIDSHTAAFISSKWSWSVGLHRILSRGALVTIVHNASQEKIVNRWGCRYCVIDYTPGDYPEGVAYPFQGKFNLAVVNTFVKDEPLEEIFNAATYLPEVSFYFSGDSTRIHQSLLAKKPDNCILTGYLSYNQYIGLLHGADAVLDLTDRDHTLLMGGFEAVSLGKPLITSDWPILKDYFSSGTIHVSNTVEGIVNGVRQMLREQSILQQDILLLRGRLQLEWEQNIQALKQLLQENPAKSKSVL